MAKPKILIIDDERFMRQALSSRLKEDDYDIIEAENGDEGFNLAKQKQPQLVLLDVLMPGKIGYGVLEDLKKETKTKHIPVVVFSRLPEEDGKKPAMKLGAKEYVSKTSCSLSELIEKIKAAVNA